MQRINDFLADNHWKIIMLYLIIYDSITIVLSYFLALWFRFDCAVSRIDQIYMNAYLKFIVPYTLICLVIYWAMRLYKSVWRYASFTELLRITLAVFITFLIHGIGITAFLQRMPITYYVIGIMLQGFFAITIRFAYRFILLLREQVYPNNSQQKQVMLVGAGQAGQMILRDIMTSTMLKERVVCIIDDNPNRWGRYMDGVPIVAGTESIPEVCEQYGIEKIYVAIPSATLEQRRRILSYCNETMAEVMQLPGMMQLITGKVTIAAMKKIEVEDLLGRKPVRVDMEDIYKYISGKTVLITGGGGSIGSELARQVAAHSPKKLIIFDVYENNAYNIQLELLKKYPFLDLEVLIGSVRDSRKIFQVFEKYQPEIVYHAAAHKHVPLMEDSPCESIKNNTIGTYKTAYAAMANHCKRFVLISTDKAVNPTNIMGATKRLCEMIIQVFDAKIKQGKAEEIPQLFTHFPIGDHVNENIRTASTEFVAVRFGNVLGSNGSVIPLFKKQIERGGPVTVTHPDIIRYFMTIPEAVSLVMQAGIYAKGGEIFVLDMGEPVKVDTLARNLIKLSGFIPDVDIKIEYTGLRPGEKLYEEKLMAEEGLLRTDNELIHIGCPIPFKYDEFIEQLKELMDAAYQNRDNMKELVQKVVTTYHPE
ncbi:MAG: polysaccharide biosynthesis protein [Lachnospiraceae bacterium]|nr:polysaccharide biosynthesis protein [Lachnospiraceae bacterium]